MASSISGLVKPFASRNWTRWARGDDWVCTTLQMSGNKRDQTMRVRALGSLRNTMAFLRSSCRSGEAMSAKVNDEVKRKRIRSWRLRHSAAESASNRRLCYNSDRRPPPFQKISTRGHPRPRRRLRSGCSEHSWQLLGQQPADSTAQEVRNSIVYSTTTQLTCSHYSASVALRVRQERCQTPYVH